MEPRIHLYDFVKHISLASLKAAPAGQRAAFQTTTCDEESDGYRKELWLYQDGRLSQASIPQGCAFFEWETGETLLAGWRRGETTQLCRLNAANNTVEQEWTLPFPARMALPLPDGRLAVTIQRDQNAQEPGIHQAYEIFEELPLSQNAVGYTSGIRTELSLYRPDTGTLTPVATPPFDVEQVQLTPDRGSLVYSGRAYQDMRLLNHAIWRYDLASGERQEVLSQDKKMFLGHFACGDDSVIYSATDCADYGFGQIKLLYRFQFSTGKTQMIHGCQRNVGVTEVLSDGRRGDLSLFQLHDGQLYVGSTWGYQTHIFRLNRDNRMEKLLPMDGSADALAVTADGTLLVIGHQGQRLQELYRMEGGELVQVSTFNEEFYRKAKPAKPRHFTFENDGVELDGWVLLPDGFDQTKCYPAILDIHGGPRLVYGEIYFHEMQAWCAMGYVVMYCNPRGGSGKGNQFSDLWNPKKLGEWDYQDVMAFVDQVLERYPNIDSKRLGVTGGSYGGFLTNWIIGQTGRFAAAASQRSISNWFANALTSDNGYYDWDRLATTDIWTDVEQLWRYSPIRYAKNATTPTLFEHGFEDYRCPFSEALQMFTCLKMNGVPTRLCAFYHENHEMSRNGRISNRKKRLDEITNWFDRYLRSDERD